MSVRRVGQAKCPRVADVEHGALLEAVVGFAVIGRLFRRMRLQRLFRGGVGIRRYVGTGVKFAQRLK